MQKVQGDRPCFHLRMLKPSAMGRGNGKAQSGLRSGGLVGGEGTETTSW
jgi:hypothetical protein